MRPLYSLTWKQQRRLADGAKEFVTMDYEDILKKMKGIKKHLVLEMLALNTETGQALEMKRYLKINGREEEWLDLLLLLRRKNPKVYRSVI